jgi:hypothetical protein
MYREIFAISVGNHTKSIHTKFIVFDVKEGGTYSGHHAVKGYRCKKYGF